MSNLTDFFPSGGGGGLTPKFQEFTSSGTFTPSQELIDAGGYIEVFLVGGGSGGFRDQIVQGGQGGEVQTVRMYLTNTNPISVTIGAGGQKSYWNTISSAVGGQSVFDGSSAGGTTITSVGGRIFGGDTSVYNSTMLSPGFGGRANDASNSSAPGNGVNGYGMGGGTEKGIGAYTSAQKPNSGQGGVSGVGENKSTEGASGYCLIKWYE